MLKSKAAAQTMDDEAKDQRKVRRKTAVFQEHQTLEEALAAGLRCTKCVATKQSTKGCKACMGKWFEAIMQPILIQVLIDSNLLHMHIYNNYKHNYIMFLNNNTHV